MADRVDGPRRVVLGLGNPGPEYAATRHNLGFLVVEELARRRRLAWDREECRSRVTGDDELLLVMPQTFMNRSGYAARCLVERRELVPQEILVIYDEVHLPLGKQRLRRGGSPAGHRGMESVIENLGTDDVPRLRLGIAPEGGAPEGGDELVSFVLGRLGEDELEIAEAMVGRAADACEIWVRDGVESAMRLNG